MPLQGTFDILDFTEILHLLGGRGVTGRLHLRSRSITANLFFEEGSLVGADQSEHQPAAATGDVRGRLEEVCFELLDADRGSFEFQPGKPTSLPGAVRLKVDTVLSRARTRLDEWRALTERVPSLDVHPRVVTDLDTSEVTLDKERWRMLTAIDGRRNLRAIGRTLNLSDFEACRLLVDLLDAGVADIDDVAKATAANRDVVPTIPVPEGLVEAAAELDTEAESVTVTGVRRPPTSPDRPRQSDEDKRATTRPTTLGSGPRPGLPAPEAESATEAGNDPAATDTDLEEARSRRRRRARLRTPGGGIPNEEPPAVSPRSAEADHSPSGGPEPTEANGRPGNPGPAAATASPTAPEPPDTDVSAEEPSGLGSGEASAEGRRPRRVIRIRSRAEPRHRPRKN